MRETVRVGTAIFGILVGLLGFFMTRIADALGFAALRTFADATFAGVSVRWIVVGIGAVIFLIGLALPGPYYYPAPGPGPYRGERVVEREVPVGERVVETPAGEKVVREESESREVVRE